MDYDLYMFDPELADRIAGVIGPDKRGYDDSLVDEDVVHYFADVSSSELRMVSGLLAAHGEVEIRTAKSENGVKAGDFVWPRRDGLNLRDVLFVN